MSQKLFEFAILHHPAATKDETERGVTPRSAILVDMKRVLAKDDKEASVLAAREIPETHTDQLDRVEIVLRPF